MSARKKPTSVLLHFRNKTAAALYRACAEGHIKDIKKLKLIFQKACKEFNERYLEDEKIKAEKEARKLERMRKHEQKQRKRKTHV